MKIITMVILSLTIIACGNTKELTAPCTYNDRSGCGELIYIHEE